jgi:competence protein CoiA
MSNVTMLYAEVDGTKRRPSPGLVGKCYCCQESVIAKCGPIKVWHWSHRAGTDCDPWSEGIGPWHLAWQNMVRPEHAEVTILPHRADIRTQEGIVVELQHSPISGDDIAAREEFYGDMVWLFDATFRFARIESGDRVFFSIGRTKHLELCKKPMFLDFGETIVEVEAFTKFLPGFSGFGRKRDREWFVLKYLNNSLVKEPQRAPVKSTDERNADPWESKKPYQLMSHPTKWIDVPNDTLITLPKGTPFIRLAYRIREHGKDWRDQTEIIIEDYPCLAAGWTLKELHDMAFFLDAKTIIISGQLTLMPSAADKIRVAGGRSRTQLVLDKCEAHIKAGRLPMLKERTKNDILRRADETDARTEEFWKRYDRKAKRKKGGRGLFG